MPDYSKGKIYTIRCHSDHSLIYVGATIQSLSVRLGEHKRANHDGKMTSISKYINNPENNTSWDDWYTELYEMFPCDNKMELAKREGEVIREIATINKNGYYIDRKEWLKSYNETHKDIIKEKKKAYREAHKDDIREKDKVYREKKKNSAQNIS